MKANESAKIAKQLKQFQSALDGMIKDIGNIALNSTLDTFRQQGYTDTSLQHWRERKRQDRKGGRGILIGQGSGASGLRGSFRKKRTSFNSISILNDKIYSGVHNEGLRSGRGRGFQMPERRMIGNSYQMNRKIAEKINFRMNKIFK